MQSEALRGLNAAGHSGRWSQAQITQDTTMLLRHGTSSKNLESILNHGLIPRGEEKGNWEHSVSSRPDCVYLTSIYSSYFACSACEDEPWMMVEIDTDVLDQSLLLPDEDFLEQVTRTQTEFPCFGKEMKERTEWFRDNLESFQRYWMDSVEKLGNCCHQGWIEPDAITRIAIFDPKQDQRIAWSAMDPIISVLNKFFCGQKYQQLTEEIFEKYTIKLETR